MRIGRTAVSILIGCAIPILALCLSVGTRPPTQQELLWSDLPWYFTPTFAVLHRALHEGFFPLWNSWQLAGWPFLAAFQTQVLYPPAWAVAWLPPHIAVTVYNCVHWASAFVGMCAFASSIGLATAGAFAAATVFTLSGALTNGFFTHSAGLAACSWFPWVALASLGVVRSDAPLRPLAIFALVVAMTILAGAPEHFLYLAASVAVVGLWQGAGHGRTLRNALLLAAGFALGAVIAAAQILPTIELMQHAVRSPDTFVADYIARFQVPTASLVRAVSGVGGGPGHLTIFLVPLVLAALAVNSTRRPAAFVLVCGLVVLDHLRGNAGFVFPFVYDWVPFVRAFRTQLRAEFVWVFFGTLAIAYGVEAIDRTLAGRIDERPAAEPARARRFASVAAIAVVAVLFGETAHRALSNRSFVPLGSRELLYGTPDLEAALAETRGPDRVFVHFGAPDAGLQHKLGQMQNVHDVADYDALVPERYARLFRMPPEKPWMGRLQFSERTKDLGAKVVAVPGVRIASLDLLSARYYVARGGAADWLEGWVDGTIRHRGDYTVVERAAARPRVYVVHSAIPAATPEDALSRLSLPGFDAATTAIVTGEAPALDPPADGAVETAAVTTDEPNEVRIDASCASRCLVVLTDLDFPGWHATVDGNPATILATNYLVRGIALAAGRHEVVFRYLPASVVAGASISLAGLAFAGVVLARTRRRR